MHLGTTFMETIQTRFGQSALLQMQNNQGRFILKMDRETNNNNTFAIT